MKGRADRERSFELLFWALPAAALALAYLYLAFHHSTPFLLGRMVHENGRYTLLQTIFYFSHFVREIPIGVLSGSIVAFSFLLHAPAPPSGGFQGASRVTAVSVWAALALAAGAFLAAALDRGFAHTWQDLFQFRTREGESAFGSHWSGHFLHLVFIFALAMGLAFLYRGVTGRCRTEPGRAARAAVLVWASVFLALELLFSGAAEALSMPRTLAHEFREILTHGLITVPLCFAALARLEQRSFKFAEAAAPRGGLVRKAILCVLIAALTSSYIAARLYGIDVLSLAQKETSLWDLLASHAFEHTLDYFFTPLVAVSTYSLLINRSIKYV